MDAWWDCEALDVMFYKAIMAHKGKYDRIVSVGMFEQVGYKNYGEFMRVARGLL